MIRSNLQCRVHLHELRQLSETASYLHPGFFKVFLFIYFFRLHLLWQNLGLQQGRNYSDMTLLRRRDRSLLYSLSQIQY